MLEKRYNLKGLKIWYIAMIVNVVFAVLSGAINGFQAVANPYSQQSSLTYITGIISLATAIAMIIAVYMLREYSQYFVKAFKHLIMAYAFMIVGCVILIVIFAELAAGAFLGRSISGIGVLLMLVALAMLIVSLVFSLIAMRDQLMGMRDIALDNENYELAEKFASIWKMYWVALIVLCVFGVLMFIAFIQFGGSLAYSYYGGGSIGLLVIGALGFLGVSIFMLVLQVLMIIRAKALCDLYNGCVIASGGNKSGVGMGMGFQPVTPVTPVAPAAPVAPASVPQTDASGHVEPMHYGSYGSSASAAPQQPVAPAPVAEPVVEPIAETPVAEPVVEPIAETPAEKADNE